MEKMEDDEIRIFVKKERRTERFKEIEDRVQQTLQEMNNITADILDKKTGNELAVREERRKEGGGTQSIGRIGRAEWYLDQHPDSDELAREQVITDIIADLMHYCAEWGIEFEQRLEMAKRDG